MTEQAAVALAELAEEAAPPGAQAVIFFGIVTAATSTTVTVLPDASDAVAIGPLSLIGSRALTAGNKVCCIRLRDGAIGCLGKVL